MQGYELTTLLDILEFTYRDSWEQSRFLAYVIAQTQSSKTLKLTDIVKFSWDNETSDKEGKIDNVSKQDKQRLIEKMNKIIEEKNK